MRIEREIKLTLALAMILAIIPVSSAQYLKTSKQLREDRKEAYWDEIRNENKRMAKPNNELPMVIKQHISTRDNIPIDELDKILVSSESYLDHTERKGLSVVSLLLLILGGYLIYKFINLQKKKMIQS